MINLENITVESFIVNYKVFKKTFDSFLTPFFNAKMVRQWKVTLYSLKIAEWKKDKIWETLNDDFTLDEFKKIIQSTK